MILHVYKLLDFDRTDPLATALAAQAAQQLHVGPGHVAAAHTERRLHGGGAERLVGLRELLQQGEATIHLSGLVES